MKKDILVEEIRERANEHWEKYDYDIKKISNVIKAEEEKTINYLANDRKHFKRKSQLVMKWT